jgi:ribosomal protein S18 acetylase RimI-like enzyme
VTQLSSPQASAQTFTERFAVATALGLRLRPVREIDLPFLAQLYASTRREELALVPWPDATKQAFLTQQFWAQHTHYQQHYSAADWLVILLGDEPIGRLYLARWTREHRIIDIALLPEHRRQRFGSALIHDILNEAAAAGNAVSIHVEKNNPAMALYRRLGFVFVLDKGVYDLMRWAPRRNEQISDHAKTASY